MTKLLIEYLRPDKQSLRLIDLGAGFLQSSGLPLANADRPMRVEAEPLTSKAGNTYYEYQHVGLPLPDGLDTLVRIAGVIVPMGEEYSSQSGHPTRAGQVVIPFNGIDYEASVFLVKGKKPYWVKVHAHKASRTARQNAGPLSGGRIV